MAKGAISKETITNKILEVFPGSFIVDKIIRIPMTENGDPIEIKVTLTAAKDILGGAGTAVDYSFPTVDESKKTSEPAANVEPTKEEKENLEQLLTALGLN